MIESIQRDWFSNVRADLLAGLVVALALIPEAIAFSIIAGVDPKVGLYASFCIAVVIAFVGGRPGMISAATGAMALLMVTLVKEHGLEYLLAATLLTGVLQIAAGFLRLGDLMRFVSRSVVTGFVNALAILIFMAQLPELTGVTWPVYAMTAAGLGIIYLFPLLPGIGRSLPSPLVCIVVLTAVALLLNLDIRTVGDMGELPDTLPVFLWPDVPWNLETLQIILPYSAGLATVGLLESMMTAAIVDDLTDTSSDRNRECKGQGVANIASGLLGGMAGCAMIGQSIINVNAGGRGRLSGITAALSLLCFILFGSAYIELVPIAALTGIMFMVVIGTFAWSSLRIMHKIPKSDALVLISVSVLTVMFDLAVAVFVGIIMSALVFSWENALRIRARKRLKDDGTKVYEIWGPLFFGSTKMFVSKFDIKDDPEHVEIDFVESRVSDYSGIEAISGIVEKYEKAGKQIKLKHLSTDCKKLLNKADAKYKSIILEKVDDPRYHVVADPNSFN